MKGSIRPGGRGSWQLRWPLPPGPNGERRQGYETFHGTKSEAEKRLIMILAQVHTGTYAEPAKMTLGSYLDVWLDHAKTNVTAKTLQEYTKIVNTHIKPQIGHIPLPKLKPLHIQSYYTNRLESGRVRKLKPPKPGEPPKEQPKGLSAQTVKHHHT